MLHTWQKMYGSERERENEREVWCGWTGGRVARQRLACWCFICWREQLHARNPLILNQPTGYPASHSLCLSRRRPDHCPWEAEADSETNIHQNGSGRMERSMLVWERWVCDAGWRDDSSTFSDAPLTSPHTHCGRGLLNEWMKPSCRVDPHGLQVCPCVIFACNI